MELGVVAEADQVAQQAGAVDARAAVGDGEVRPVRLPGHRAVGLQQRAGERLLDDVGRIGGQQGRIGRAIGVDVEVQPIDALAGQRRHRRQTERHRHRRTGGRGEVGFDLPAQLRLVGEARAVAGVQVKLEGLGFDQVRRIRRHLERRGCHPRLAARVQPGQFVGMPAIYAGERQRARVEADRRAAQGARDGIQQAGIELPRVGDLAAERRVLDGGHLRVDALT